MIAVRRILQWVDFVVCPYDGTNLKAVGRPSSLAVPLPMLEPFIGQAVLVEKRVRPDGARSNAASATFGELASRRQSETDGIGDAAA